MSLEVQAFNRLLQTAAESGATDVHVKTGAPALFRINRELVPVESPIPTELWMSKVVKEVVPPHLWAGVGRKPDLAFSYFVSGVGRFRTYLFRQRGHWSFAMRHLKTELAGFVELGLPDQIRRIAEAPRGIVLVGGTAGSGKSTTLAAMIEHINTCFKKHIVTLEDPIEYILEDKESMIEQREIGVDTDSFHEALTHVLRLDPDVIMIGELRDATSFAAATSAADTGHLVLSTLHTVDASESVNRILDCFTAGEREQARRRLAETLHAVICQRLVPTLSGGITPALEIMINSPTVKKLLLENRLERLAAAIESGSEDGMVTFNQALYQLVKQGKVSREEALSKAANPQALEMNLDGTFSIEDREHSADTAILAANGRRA